MSKAVLMTSILGLAISGASALAASSDGPVTLKTRVHVSSLRCETAADGSSVTLLGGDSPVPAVSGPKFQYPHQLAWAVGCDPVAVEALKKKAVEFFMFAFANLTVEHNETQSPTEEPGRCAKTLSERVTISFAPSNSNLTLSTTVSATTDIVDCSN